MCSPQNHGEGGSEQVRYGSQPEPLDMPFERFFAVLRFENRGAVDELGSIIDYKCLKSTR